MKPYENVDFGGSHRSSDRVRTETSNNLDSNLKPAKEVSVDWAVDPEEIQIELQKDNVCSLNLESVLDFLDELEFDFSEHRSRKREEFLKRLVGP